MTDQEANDLSDCGYGCYIIGGPWISYNPACPKHGTSTLQARTEVDDTFTGTNTVTIDRALALFDDTYCDVRKTGAGGGLAERIAMKRVLQFARATASERAKQVEPAALDEHDEFMASAAFMTSGWEFPRDPKPSRDWTLFREGWLAAANVYAAPPAVQAEPFGYAYEYPDGIRFDTGAREINGNKPIRAIALYTAPPADDETVRLLKRAKRERAKELVERLDTWPEGCQPQGITGLVRSAAALLREAYL